MENLAGHAIKGYELQERIGTGGFGAVYRAYQSTIGREVAVKIILPGFANHPDFIRRFESEAQIVARLEHPYITPLFDYWRDPDGAYLVMRWLRGGSLRDVLRKQPFDAEGAALLLDQITAALSVAHRNNVIHRDLKPGNILLDEDGNAYLADFGIAKDIGTSSNTEIDAIVGSPDYLSPEQARSEPVTPQTDVYSLGVVLYEMLTGEHPFPGLSAIERLYKHLSDPLPQITSLPDDTSDSINAVIQKATAKNPAHRYVDAPSMAAAFREAIRSQQGQNVVETLTQREQEILQRVIAGHSNRQIAADLVVTVGTVKWYITQIYRKLNVRSRVQAIVRARELNLIVNGSTPSAAASLTAIPTDDFRPENPYKGLRAFHAADYRDFFGREKLVDKLIKRMGETGELTRFLAIVGPSGSGKSSLVRAGLIPALWRGELRGSETWFVVEMIPGTHPLDELEIALTKIAANQSINLREHLERDARGLVRVGQLILPDDGSELVLVIDQFEEVFTLLEDEAARVHFLDLLYAAVTEPRSRIRVIVTLRADFYDRPLHYPQFGELVRSRLETLLPLSADGLERAITRPAEQVGVMFEPGLVASIIGDVNYQPGVLPLLQYALTELFEMRSGRLLTHEAYQAIGGTVGALAKRAEEVYEGLDETGQETVRQLFLRLVTLGEGAEDTRRRTARSELTAITDDPDAIDEIIDTFAAYRLLSLDTDPGTRSPTVEVAHEALLREWERLRAWLNDSRDEIKLQRQLAAMAAEWHTARQDASFLAHGSRLDQFEAWAAQTGLALTAREHAYLDASIAERERQTAAETARQARETRLEQRSQTFLRGLVAVLLVATLGAFLLTGYAFSAQQTAENERDISQELAIVNGVQLALFSNNGDQARALALQINRNANPSAQAQRALGDAMYPIGTIRVINSSREISDDPSGNVGNVSGVVFSPDSSSIFAGEANQISQWDVATGAVRHIYDGHEDRVLTLAISPDGTYLLSGDYAGALILRTIADDTIVQKISLNADQITAMTFDPSGSQAMIGTSDGTLVLMSIPDMEIVHHFTGHIDAIGSVAISPDGRMALSGSYDATLRLWDFQTREPLHVFDATNGGHNAAVTSVAFSPDSKMALSGSYDITTTLWNLSNYTADHRFVEPAPVHDVAFSPNGQLILSNSFESPTLWDFNSKSMIARLIGHSALVYGAAFSPDGNYLATRGLDRTIRLWSTNNGAEVNMAAIRLPLPITMELSPDGHHLVIGSAGQDAFREMSGETILFDAATGQEIRTFGEQQPGLNIYAVAFSPDSKTIVSSGFIWDKFDSTILTLWDAATGKALHTLEGHHTTVYAVSFSPDGGHLLTGSETNEAALLLWDVVTGQMLQRYDEASGTSHGTIAAIAYSPDGGRAYIGYGDGALLELDLNSGHILREFGANGHKHTGRIWTIAVNPDAQTLVTGSDDTTLILWDVKTGESIRSFSGHVRTVQDAAFSHNGRWIFSVGDNYVIQWDVSTGEAVRRFPHFAVKSVAVSLDDDFVYSSGYDFGLRTWRIDTQEQLMAWATANRYIPELTCDQRELYRLEPLCSPEGG